MAYATGYIKGYSYSFHPISDKLCENAVYHDGISLLQLYFTFRSSRPRCKQFAFEIVTGS